MNVQKMIIRNFKGITDSTLREGFQFSRANFSLVQQKKIFNYLSRIGVDYIEVGNPVNREIQEMVIALLENRNGNSPKILSHIRNQEHDLQKALESQVNGVNILCTVDSERIASMRITYDQYLERLRQNIVMAKKDSLEVRVGVEDFFSQSQEKSLGIYELAQDCGIERLGVADTLGKAMAWEILQRIGELRQRFSMDIEVHFHNDLGHAVSNALAALQAGANWVSTTLAGIGERTGITPLSSLLLNLYILNQKLTGRYNLSLLTQAENYISKICHIQMPINLMTNLSQGFTHKAGIHLDAMIKFGAHKYEFISPKTIGNQRNLIVNTLISGKTQAHEAEEFNKRYK